MAILAIKLKHLGDTLLLTPALRHLKRHFPARPICVVVRGDCEPALANNPDVDSMFAFGRLGAPRVGFIVGLAELLRFRRWQRQWRFEMAINFFSSDRGAWCAYLSRAPRRIAWRVAGEDFPFGRLLHNDTAMLTPGVCHEVEKDLRLAEYVTGRREENPRLVFHLPPSLLDWAESRWRQLEGNTRGGVRIHCHATSRWMFKCWSDEGTAGLIDRLLLAHGGMALLSAGDNAPEQAKARRICSLARGRVEIIHPPLPFERLGAIIARADLFVGIDSAPMHLAAAVGLPTVAIFGPTDPQSWRPWSEAACVVEADCRCRRNGVWYCSKDKTLECLAALTPDRVHEAVLTMLRRGRRPG